MPQYSVIVAPIANAQIEAALLWWNRNRPASPGPVHTSVGSWRETSDARGIEE